MWDLIVSVPDHCLSFYFAISHTKFLFKNIFGHTVYIHHTGDMTRASVMPRKVTVKIGDAENRCR